MPKKLNHTTQFQIEQQVLKSASVSPPTLFFFKIVLGIPGPLSISTKKSAGILTAVALSLTSRFWVRTAPISLSTRVEPKELLPAYAGLV